MAHKRVRSVYPAILFCPEPASAPAIADFRTIAAIKFIKIEEILLAQFFPSRPQIIRIPDRFIPEKPALTH